MSALATPNIDAAYSVWVLKHVSPLSLEAFPTHYEEIRGYQSWFLLEMRNIDGYEMSLKCH